MKYNHLTAFEKHLASSAPAHFAPLYLLLSKEDFNRKTACEKLIKYLLGEQTANPLSLSIYDGEKGDVENVLQELNSGVFFSGKRVVVLHHAEDLPKAATEKLLTYYEKPNPSVYLILTASSLSAATNFYKKSELKGVVLEMAEEKPWEKEKSLKEWIDQKVVNYGKKIESAANQLLLKQIGTDQAILNIEIEKLVCYIGENHQISERDVEAICVSTCTENVWQLGEAIFRFDASTALRIALALLKENTPLLMLLRQIRSQFQTDFQVCTILIQGGSGLDVTKQFGYMKGQILEKHIQLSKNYGIGRFRKGMLLIDEAELAAKNSAVENSYLIEKLIIRLAT